MKFLGNLEQVEGSKYRVGLVHYRPELLQNTEVGILVEDVPEPLQQEGKSAILYVNIDTKEPFYEYEDAPKTEEETLKDRIYELEQGQANTEYILMEGGLI